MSVVSSDVAWNDITRWLEYKKVSESKREAQKDSIQTLVNAIADGDLTIDDKCIMNYKLKFPPDAEKPVTELNFKPRITVGSIIEKQKGLEPGDLTGKLTAIGAALTGLPRTFIAKLDTDDFSLVQSIAVFFI